MQIPLSRIEYSYVFETFLQELPPLLLQSGALFYMLPSGAYTIKNSRLYFQSLPEFIGKKIAVFFDHKKRSIVFYTAIYADDGSCFFTLPDSAYKEQCFCGNSYTGESSNHCTGTRVFPARFDYPHRSASASLYRFFAVSLSDSRAIYGGKTGNAKSFSAFFVPPT